MRKLVNAAQSMTLLICGGAAVVAAPPPATEHSYVASLRRLTEQEYRHSIADIFGQEIEVRGAFEPTIRAGGLAAASTATLSVTPAGFESFSKMANDIATQVTAEKYRSKLPCAPKDAKAPDDACAGKILGHYGLLLFRRPLTDVELKDRVGLSRRMAEKTNDFYAGMRYSLSMLLQLPDFIFRSEVASNGTLEPYSRATRLSFFLWNSTPDSELLRRQRAASLTQARGWQSRLTG